MDMKMFLKGKAQNLPEVETIITERYLDENGKAIPFKFKAIPSKMIDEIKRDCTKNIYHKGQKIEKFDQERFVAKVAVETTTFPNFKDGELLESYSCVDPVDLAHEILSLPGEYTTWVEEAFKTNGFDDKFEDLVADAKN
ncbi:hypothetical protein [Clostridium sp. HMP27]|uniref:phage tail assembly chaperone n=1 Tax=Clostridium sp. HMP27 TaxID=1487921 RepID=UPI00052D6BA5|nr:hypothetical protein [Clostridium sp. HMP27]KGK88042.1 hypothetical protein DP68_08930 [Clostridium sp. HMP27]